MARRTVVIHDNPKEIHIDIEQIKSLAALGLTKEKMARILKIDRHTLKNIEDRDKEIDAAIQEGRILGEVERRRKRRELYNDGFWPALKHAMSTEDGINETNKAEVSGPNGSPLIPDDGLLAKLIDLAQKESDIKESEMPSTIAEKVVQIAPDKKALFDSTIAIIKRRSKESLFYFARNVLGYTDLIPRIHGVKDGLILKEPRVLDLGVKGTYKTSHITVSVPIWIHQFHYPNARIASIHHNSGMSSDYLVNSRTHYERNELLLAIVGDQRTDRWNDSEYNLKCRTDYKYKESSHTAIGLLSDSTAGHYDIIIIDDGWTEKDRASGLERERTLRGFQKIESLCLPHTHIWMQGTRWHMKDLAGYVKNELNSKLPEGKKWFVLESDIEDEKGESAYPEIWPDKAALQEQRAKVGDFVWYCAYRNKPISDDTRIYDLSKLNYFNMSEINWQNMEIYKACDPAFGDSKHACYSPIITGAFDRATKRLYIIDVDMKQRTINDLLEAIIQNILRIPCRIFYGEINFSQGAYFKMATERIKEWEMKAGRALGWNFSGVNNTVKKEVRITQLQPALRDVWFRDDYRNDPPYLEMMAQLEGFPIHDFVDGPDCLELLVNQIFNSVQLHGGNWAPRAIKKSY